MAKGAANAPKVLWGAYRQVPPYHVGRMWYALVGQGMVIFHNNQEATLYVEGIGRLEDTDAALDPMLWAFKVRIETNWMQKFVQDQMADGKLMEHAHLANMNSELLFAQDDEHGGAYTFTAVNKLLWPQVDPISKSNMGVEFVKSDRGFAVPPAVHALFNELILGVTVPLNPVFTPDPKAAPTTPGLVYDNELRAGLLTNPPAGSVGRSPSQMWYGVQVSATPPTTSIHLPDDDWLPFVIEDVEDVVVESSWATPSASKAAPNNQYILTISPTPSTPHPHSLTPFANALDSLTGVPNVVIDTDVYSTPPTTPTCAGNTCPLELLVQEEAAIAYTKVEAENAFAKVWAPSPAALPSTATPVPPALHRVSPTLSLPFSPGSLPSPSGVNVPGVIAYGRKGTKIKPPAIALGSALNMSDLKGAGRKGKGGGGGGGDSSAGVVVVPPFEPSRCDTCCTGGQVLAGYPIQRLAPFHRLCRLRSVQHNRRQRSKC